jgi:hypothetical protein
MENTHRYTSNSVVAAVDRALGPPPGHLRSAQPTAVDQAGHDCDQQLTFPILLCPQRPRSAAQHNYQHHLCVAQHHGQKRNSSQQARAICTCAASCQVHWLSKQLLHLESPTASPQTASAHHLLHPRLKKPKSLTICACAASWRARSASATSTRARVDARSVGASTCDRCHAGVIAHDCWGMLFVSAHQPPPRLLIEVAAAVQLLCADICRATLHAAQLAM